MVYLVLSSHVFWVLSTDFVSIKVNTDSKQPIFNYVLPSLYKNELISTIYKNSVNHLLTLLHFWSLKYDNAFKQFLNSSFPLELPFRATIKGRKCCWKKRSRELIVSKKK